jgi:hypothetical protein
MRGVSLTGFETCRFYPGRRTLGTPPGGSDLCISLDTRVLPARLRTECAKGCALYLDFIGRETVVSGAYGHMGSAKNLIIIDRVLAAKPLS